MKKVLAMVLIVIVLASTLGCVRGREVHGVQVSSYGFANKDDAVEGVEYEVSVRNAVWSALAVETVIVPILYFMFYVWVPIKE